MTRVTIYPAQVCRKSSSTGTNTMGHKKPDILLVIAVVVILGAVTGSFITDAAPDTSMAPQQAGILVQ